MEDRSRSVLALLLWRERSARRQHNRLKAAHEAGEVASFAVEFAAAQWAEAHNAAAEVREVFFYEGEDHGG